MQGSRRNQFPRFKDERVKTAEVPRWVLDSGLFFRWSPALQAVYMSLIAHAQGYVACYPKIQTICEQINLTEKSVYPALKQLEKDGAILRNDRGGGRHGLTFVICWPGLNLQTAETWSRFSSAQSFQKTGGDPSENLEGYTSSKYLSTSSSKAQSRAPAGEEVAAAADSILKDRMEKYFNRRTVAQILAKATSDEHLRDVLDNAEALEQRYRKRKKPFNVAGYIVNHHQDATLDLAAEVKAARKQDAEKAEAPKLDQLHREVYPLWSRLSEKQKYETREKAQQLPAFKRDNLVQQYWNQPPKHQALLEWLKSELAAAK